MSTEEKLSLKALLQAVEQRLVAYLPTASLRISAPASPATAPFSPS